MRRSVLVILLAGLAVPCTPALAATVRVDHEQDALVYRAAPGERNHFSMTASNGSITVADSVPIRPGVGCRRAPDPGRVECELFGSARAIVRLGDRDDRARVLPSLDEVLMDGGSGDDVLHGSFEKDTLLGGRGTDGLRGAGGVDRLLARGYGLTTDRTADRLRGGRGSDLLMGSGGRNLIVPGPGVDKVSAGGGRDIVYARDDSIEQIHCGAGEDSAVTDGIDYPLACEHHEPYSTPSPVPLEFSSAAGSTSASLLIGCREAHPAACEGTVQLELEGRALSEEHPFIFANRHRFVVQLDTTEPMPAGGAGVVVRIRAPDAGGNPTDERYPVALMLFGDPFLGAF
ncbi:MAG TPA: calcium-binding protein [Thermoleophilaceae bacterium]|jgi:hemolysin type calcium-binding protein|nr:calcium-binding protein [Thermoleophilaceae bacterium]